MRENIISALGNVHQGWKRSSPDFSAGSGSGQPDPDFSSGECLKNETFFKIVGSHTDSPSIKIKPSPEIIENDYLKLNVEIYGGPILNTWLDRPLGISGRVYTKSENAFLPKPHIININKPLMIIPNLAIHQNREVNKGVELNRQIDMLPIATLIKEKSEQNNFLIELI